MKLNKVLALALSGVMAVSMLAGCKGETGNGDQDNSSSQVVVSDAATTLNKIQKVVDFGSDATLDGYMKGVESLKPSVVKNLTEGNYATQVEELQTNGGVVKSILKLMSYTDSQNVAGDFTAFESDPATNKDDKTQTVFYAIKADDILSIEHLMVALTDTLDTADFKSYVTVSSDKYAVDYTGDVSVVKVSKTDEDNKTYNAYVIGVSITRTVGDKVNV